MSCVSVHIVTWDSEDYITTCLEAVFQQRFTDFAVTVVDNGSVDRSAAIVESWSDRGVNLIRNATNEGYAAAHNKAITMTESEFVLTLNPDVILDVDFLAQMVESVRESPSIGSAAGQLLRITPEQFHTFDNINTAHRPSTIDSAGLIMARNRRQHLRGYREDASSYMERERIFGPDGAAALYRRAMLDDVEIEGDVFDTLLVTHKEDVDLAWRAQLLGWESIYAPGAIGYHIRGFRPGERKQLPSRIKRDAVKNRWLINIKNDIPAIFWRDIYHTLLYDLKILGYLLLFEQRSLPAILDVVRLLPATLQRRRQIQHRRKCSDQYMGQWFV